MTAGKELAMQNPTPEQIERGVVGVLPGGVEVFDPSVTPNPEGEFRGGRRKRRNDRSAARVNLDRFANRLPHSTK